MLKCNVPVGMMPTLPSMASAALVWLVGVTAVRPSLPSHTQPWPVIPCKTTMRHTDVTNG